MTVRNDKIYTVKLRDAVWHDGQKLTAEDVVYTINLIKNPSRFVRHCELIGSIFQLEQLTFDGRICTASCLVGFSHALTFPIVPKHILQNVSSSSMLKQILVATLLAVVRSSSSVFKLLNRLAQRM